MILQRYVFRELLAAFLFCFASILAVCLVGTMFQVIRSFEGAGLLVILKVLPLALGYVAQWALLAAVTTATTLVFGRLSAENEINAMRTCGIHANRILAPAIGFGLLVAAGAWTLNEHVVPKARHARRLAFREATLEALRLPPPGRQEFRIGKLRLSYVDYQNGRMERPSLMQFETGGGILEYFAPSGSIRSDGRTLRLIMTKPRYRQVSEKGVEQTFSAENDVTIPIELEDLQQTPPQLQDRAWSDLDHIAVASPDPKERMRSRLVQQTRLAATAAPLLLILVAVPTGMFVKRGSRLAGLGAALPPLLVYFVAFFIFQGLGDKGKVDPALAAWAPDAFLAVLAAALLGGIYRK